MKTSPSTILMRPVRFPRAATCLLAACLTALLFSPAVWADGFTEANVLFYGEVRQVGGAHAVLLQSGRLEATFVNRNDPANTVTLSTELQPTGTRALRPYSYALRVPLSYLPHQAQKDRFLSIGAQTVDFHIQDITIDGVPATLPDGSKEFFPLSFASRGRQIRLDLLVQGDPTDTDGDGLPDWWETLHDLGRLTPNASADADGDGWSNVDELRNGSDPNEDNRSPQLASAEVRIPESGEAGLFLHFLDSDSPPDALALELSVPDSAAFEVRMNGSPVTAPSLDLSLEDLESGRLTVRHLGVPSRSLSLPVTWNDGTTGSTGVVVLRVVLPTSEDGHDASLWLDGNSLAGQASGIESWRDRSGNQRPATQPLAAFQPRATVDAGRTSADFSAPDAHLFFPDTALPAGDQTVLAVYHSDASSDDPQTLFAGNRGFLQLGPTAQPVSYPGAPRYQVDGLAVQGYESALGASTVSIFRREGSVLQNIFGLCYDGEALDTTSLEPLLPALGARRLALPGVVQPIRDGFHGRLHELIVFPDALAEQKLRDVHDYLQSKWAGAVIWDASTDLRAIHLAIQGSGRNIIRGGWADDELAGGPDRDVLSGGPGADRLTGGGGPDDFVFGGVDTGVDTITDFDLELDTVDLSALFWGQSGDAREAISVRLDTDTSTAVPTLNSVLLVQVPDGGTREIVLRGVALGDEQLNRLIVEGRIRMGSLRIPARVELALVPGPADPANLAEATGDHLTLELTRSGDGVAGAMDIPLGFFQEALGGSIILDGAAIKEGQRAIVRFAPGETTRRITFRPVPDLEAQGRIDWELAVLPQFRFDVDGGPVEGSITDQPRVWMEVLAPHALTDGTRDARVRVRRAGDASASLRLEFEVDGSAQEDVHVQPFAHHVEIAAGAATADLVIRAKAGGWDARQARRLHLAIVPAEGIQLGSPSEAEIFVADTDATARAAGFERWAAAATRGQASSLHELRAMIGDRGADDYVRAYVMGLDSPVDLPGNGLVLRMLGRRPELRMPWRGRDPGVTWSIRSSVDLQRWEDASSEFAEDLTDTDLRLLGPPEEDAGTNDVPAGAVRSFHLVHSVEMNPSRASAVSRIGGGARFGMEGSTRWRVESASGALVGEAGSDGGVQRLIVEADAPKDLNFEMLVLGGTPGSGALRFYIDGAQVAETTGAPVQVQHTLPGPHKALLMWESTITGGRTVIRNAP